MDRSLLKFQENFSRASKRLHLISSHDALIILQHCLYTSKLNYVLRTSPCAGHPTLSHCDDLLRKALSVVVNVQLSDDQWLQANLPVCLGGLGIRNLSMLAPSAFLSSAAATLDLQDSILVRCSVSACSDIGRCLSVWSSLSSSDYPLGPASHKQRNWDQKVCQTLFSSLLNRQVDPVDKARLLAVSAPHSSDWLQALPISSCGLRLSNEAVRVSVGLRLGCRLCEPHTCPCGVSGRPGLARSIL